MAHRTTPSPSAKDLQAAQQIFEANEPRNLFYRAATELVDLAVRQATSLSVAEALAVLLQTWNSSYYRFHGKFDTEHFCKFEDILSRHGQALTILRKRVLEDLSSQDEATITPIFTDFEVLLGPVGAAKTLHLLAPSFFPLWDREIAKAYSVGLKERGVNAGQYFSFMHITKSQCESLGGYQAIGRNPLKALDEYNYCRFSRGWIESAVEQ